MRGEGLTPKWEEYLLAMQQRFGGKLFDDPTADLLSLRQMGSVKEFQGQFELLLNRVRISQKYAISICLKGLQEEILMPICMFNPQTLEHTFALAKMQKATNATHQRRSSRAVGAPQKPALLPTPTIKPYYSQNSIFPIASKTQLNHKIRTNKEIANRRLKVCVFGVMRSIQKIIIAQRGKCIGWK